MDNHTCPFCGSSQMRLYHPAVWNRPESKVYQCEQCELIYLFPAMSEGEEKAFYLNYNRHVMTRLVHPKVMEDAGIIPEQDLPEGIQEEPEKAEPAPLTKEGAERLSVFEDFLGKLDLDKLDEKKDKPDDEDDQSDKPKKPKKK